MPRKPTIRKGMIKIPKRRRKSRGISQFLSHYVTKSCKTSSSYTKNKRRPITTFWIDSKQSSRIWPIARKMGTTTPRNYR